MFIYFKFIAHFFATRFLKLLAVIDVVYLFPLTSIHIKNKKKVKKRMFGFVKTNGGWKTAKRILWLPSQAATRFIEYSNELKEIFGRILINLPLIM